MVRMHRWIVRVLMVLLLAAVPGGFIECDLEDGELEVDLDELDLDDGVRVDLWYEPAGN